MMPQSRNKPLFREVPKPEHLKIPKIAAFDIETSGLGGDFLAGAIWTSEGERLHFSTLDGCFQYIINHPEYLYLSHNGAGYEFAYLAPLIHEWFTTQRDCVVDTLVQGNNRIIQFRLTYSPQPENERPAKRGRPRTRKQTVILQDTLCLFGMSLDNVAKAFCPELPKLKGAINFDAGEIFDPSNELHMAYLDRDCRIVLLAYSRLAENIAHVFGSKIGVTAGSTALRAFKTTIPEGHCYYRVREEVDTFIRHCYYGGLVLPGRILGHCGNIAGVDINGAYAYQMATHAFPVGNAFQSPVECDNCIGFYYVRAVVPSTVWDTVGFNPVPHRDGKRGLSWPTGDFHTYMCTPEIEFARECGCTIEVIDGYVFPRQEYVFKDFVEKCQEMELADGGIYKPTIKLVRNAAYGKFGAKTSHKVIKYSNEIIEGMEPLLDESGHEIEGLLVYEENQTAEYMLPHWAALVTAYERVYLMRFVKEAYERGAQTVYCDTDSIKTEYRVLSTMLEDEIIPVHKKYGGFKLEEVCDIFIVLGPKCYYGHLDERLMEENGINIKIDEENRQKILDFFKAKGIPKKKLDKRVYEHAIIGSFDDVPFESVKSTMSIMKEGSRVKGLKPTRKITNIHHSYAWEPDGEGHIKPRTMGEAAASAKREGWTWEEQQRQRRAAYKELQRSRSIIRNVCPSQEKDREVA